MAMMNRVGMFMYNVGLVLVVLILAMSLKNYNLGSPGETADYSPDLRSLLEWTVIVLIIYSISLLITTSASRAGSKGGLFWFLIMTYMVFLGIIVVFSHLSWIFEELGRPGWKYMIISASSVILFFLMLALILLRHPGRVDEEKLVDNLKKELKKQEEENLSFCPICKYKVRDEWKYCPNCRAKFEQ